MKLTQTIVGALTYFMIVAVTSADQVSSMDVRVGRSYWYFKVPASEGGQKLTTGFCSDPLTCTTNIVEDSYIPNLKPRGSGIAHASNGYIEHVWELSDGNALFSTEILSTGKSYLYKATRKFGGPSSSDGYIASVGNNAPNYDNGQAVLNMGERNGVQQANVRTLHQRSILEATINNQRVLFYGEYNNSSSPAVALMKSTDFGITWTKVIEWNTVGHQTRHIRGVVQNPYNGMIYILFGYQAADSAIVAWNGVDVPPPDNTPLNQIGNYPGWKSIAGSIRVRTGDLVFTPPPNGKCVWIPDVEALNPGEKLFSQRSNYDLSGLEVAGEVPYVNGIPPIIGGIANNDGYSHIYWASYRVQGAAENKIHVWKSTDVGATWGLVTKLDTFTNWTAFPNDFSVNGGVDTTDNTYFDDIRVRGRELEFVSNGNKIGSTVTIGYTNKLKAVLDTVTTTKGQSATINPTSNDINVGNSVVNVVNYPSSGNVAYANSAQTSVIYTPNTGFVGSDTFTYNLKNAAGVSNTATVTVTVTDTTTPPPPPPPTGSAVATADTGSTAVGTPVTLNLTSNDTNVGTSIVNIVGYPGHGNVAYSDSTSKSITYTPNATFIGTDTFTYNLKSSAGTSNTVTVTITVGGTTPPPPPPPTGTGAIANGDTMTTTKGKAVTLNLTSNDTNVGTSTVNIAGYPNNGNVAYSDSTKKSVTYTPDATFVGSDSFTYNLKSASGTSNTATVSVKVQ